MTDTQTTRALLGEIHNSRVQAALADDDTGRLLAAIGSSSIHSMLSHGEAVLYELARAVYTGRGGELSGLGKLDTQLRRRVWRTLTAYFCPELLPELHS